MYVLADMEWITDRHGDHWPTQLAAIRVDGSWEAVDTFSTLFRPKDLSFQQWGHMAFSGWKREDYLAAPPLYPAMDSFEQWLMPDDILCWWHQEASDLFHMFTKVAQIRDRSNKVLYLGEYLYRFLPGTRGSPYKLCEPCGISAVTPAHCSSNDVRTMLALVKGVDFPQSDLQYPVKKASDEPLVKKGTKAVPLLYDPAGKRLHRSDCELLPEDQPLPAFFSYKAPIRKKYHPCACCRDEFLDALWERNRDTISRSEYNYVYSKRSRVFHTRDCSHILLSYDIQGCISYNTCLKNGRRPCRHCKPQPIQTVPSSTPAPAKQKKRESGLSNDERRALGRFKRAKEERENALKKGELTEAERKTVMTLSQPGYAFWASRGYRTFHRRNCAKITGLNQLRGFPRYQDAVHAGYSPCRHCKPSPKQDVVFSIPITNQERHGETMDTLIRLCTEHCLPFEHDTRYFTLQTMAGKWRIDINSRPVRLEHINLVTEPGNKKKFHTQPRLFLSLQDTFDYIMRHDSQLIEEMVAKDERKEDLSMS